MVLRPIWNVPHIRNPNFTGRGPLLDNLRDNLTSGQPAAVTQAIAGLGGVGKTQLATEYAYRYAAEYSLVWWLPSEEPATLAATYAALAQRLDLPEKDATEQSVIIAAVHEWLRQNGDWLLIFDNASKPADLRDYLPGSRAGHVLITSRNPNWGGIADPLEVEVFQRDESVEFLIRRTNRTYQAAAGELAEALGDLPLALEQAGAYMEQTGASFARYLELFQTHQQELLRRGSTAQGYEYTVATTWEIALQQLPTAAADLLNLCGFLAPVDIPRGIIEKGTVHLPDSLAAVVADDLAFEDTFGDLRRYSLMEVGDNSWSVHRLVQGVVRDRLAEDDRGTWAESAARLVNGAFPFDIQRNVDGWPLCARLLPHALAASAEAENLGVAAEATGPLLTAAGSYLGVRADFASARSAYERALAISEQALGPDHPTVATRLYNLGSILHHLGDPVGAKVQIERALAISEANYGPQHSHVAFGLNNLGAVLRDQEDLAGAKECYERVVAIFEATLRPDDPIVATGLNNLGMVLLDLGDLAGAKRHIERALSIDEGAYGPDHPDVAIRLNNLAGVLLALGDLAGARKRYERALRILTERLGEEHPTTVRVRNNLASLPPL